MPENHSEAEKIKALTREGERMLKHVKDGTHLIVLDVIGKHASSEQLAENLNNLGFCGKSNITFAITFAIGGAFGLSPELVKAAHERFFPRSDDQTDTSRAGVADV